jgi:hypothetical protein
MKGPQDVQKKGSGRTVNGQGRVTTGNEKISDTLTNSTFLTAI